MSVNGSLEKTRGGGVCLRVPVHVPPPRVCGGVVEVGVNGRKEGVVTSCNKFNQNPKLTRCRDYRVLKIWRNNQRQQRKKRKLNKAFVPSVLLSMLRFQRDKISLSVSLAFHSFSQLHTKTKSLFFVVFYLFIAAGCLTNHQGSMCRVMLSIHTDTYTHTHLYVNSSTLYGFTPSLRRTLHIFVQHAHLRTLVQTCTLHNEPLDHTSGKL